MTICVFTPTCRFGSIDVGKNSLLRQNRDDLVWLIGDDLFARRKVPTEKKLKIIHFDTAQNKRANGAASSLASAYHRGIEIAREMDADLLVSMQDYLWIPDDGITRFEQMAKDHPRSLLTGLCSLSEDPYPDKVTDPKGLYTIFDEPFDGAKPKVIAWRDCRLEKWPVGIVAQADPLWWETNWAAIPRAILHDSRLNFDTAYDRGYAYENQDYAIRAHRLGYGVTIDTGNHAIGLPHTKYFPAETERLRSINNREWHEARHFAS